MKVELSLSNYATKADLEKATGIDSSMFAKKVDLPSVKSDADKLDINTLKNLSNNLCNLKNKVDKLYVDKLVPVSVDLSKLRDIVKMMLLKKMYIMVRSKIIEGKISDITNIATDTTLNAKINKVKIKVPSITNLATNTAAVTALTAL